MASQSGLGIARTAISAAAVAVRPLENARFEPVPICDAFSPPIRHPLLAFIVATPAAPVEELGRALPAVLANEIDFKILNFGLKLA